MPLWGNKIKVPQPWNAAGGQVAGYPAYMKTEKVITITFGGASADYTMNSAEEEASVILLTNANGAANLILSKPRPGKTWLLVNGSGQAITFKRSGGTGVAIANTKKALYWDNGSDIDSGPTT
jgi:hypothetical protein